MVKWWPSGGEGGAKIVMSYGGWFRLVVSDLMHSGGGNLYFLFPTALDTAFGQENYVDHRRLVFGFVSSSRRGAS